MFRRKELEKFLWEFQVEKIFKAIKEEAYKDSEVCRRFPHVDVSEIKSDISSLGEHLATISIYIWEMQYSLRSAFEDFAEIDGKLVSILEKNERQGEK